MKQEKKLRSLATLYRVDHGKQFQLRDFDPGDTAGLSDEIKGESEQLLQRSTQQLAELQDMLYAQDRWALLLIFQAMDAAGKDGTIKHVMSGVNPQGCEVFSFKAPSAEELAHDYLWRTSMLHAGTRQNRDLQSLLLRRSPGGARPPGVAGSSTSAGGLRQRQNMEGALRRHLRL